MKNNFIGIVVGDDRALKYGIGTYVDSVVKLLACNESIDIAIIKINVPNISKITVKTMEHYTELNFPSVIGNRYNKDSYARMVAIAIQTYFHCDLYNNCLLHLNMMNYSSLPKYLKRYINCSVILTVHYANWIFGVEGNINKLHKILHGESDNRQAFFNSLIEEDHKMIIACDRIIFVSKESYNNFISVMDIGIKECSIVHHYIDTLESFHFESTQEVKRKFNLPDEGILVIYAGRLDLIKGVDILLSTFAEICSTNKNIRLILCGDGSLRQKSSDNIRFLGRIDKRDLYSLYKQSDIGIVPSIYEDFGYTAIEMMNFGLPVIVSDVGGLSEIVDDAFSGYKVKIMNRNGNLVPDVEQFKYYIELLVCNNTIRNSIKVNAMKSIQERFSKEVFKKKMSLVYGINL